MGEEKSGESSTSNGGSGNGTGTTLKRECKFRNVWAKNLEEEFKLIRTVVRKYPYIAMVSSSVASTVSSVSIFVYILSQMSNRSLKCLFYFPCFRILSFPALLRVRSASSNRPQTSSIRFSSVMSTF